MGPSNTSYRTQQYFLYGTWQYFLQCLLYMGPNNVSYMGPNNTSNIGPNNISYMVPDNISYNTSYMGLIWDPTILLIRDPKISVNMFISYMGPYDVYYL